MGRTLSYSEVGDSWPVLDMLGCMVPICTWVQGRLKD